MRSYSIRDLCRQASNPESIPDVLDWLMFLAEHELTRSHRVRLYAALLGNPALSLADACRLIEKAPCWGSHYLCESLATPISRAIERNPAWVLHKIADPGLEQIPHATVRRLWWSSVSTE